MIWEQLTIFSFRQVKIGEIGKKVDAWFGVKSSKTASLFISLGQSIERTEVSTTTTSGMWNEDETNAVSRIRDTKV